MPTPFQIEDALRRSDPPPAPPPPPPSQTDSGVSFGKKFTPEEKKRQAEKLAEVLRKRGG